MLGAERLARAFPPPRAELLRLPGKRPARSADRQCACWSRAHWSGIRCAIGKLFRGAEMFHGGLELDSFLSGEPGQLEGLDNLERCRGGETSAILRRPARRGVRLRDNLWLRRRRSPARSWKHRARVAAPRRPRQVFLPENLGSTPSFLPKLRRKPFPGAAAGFSSVWDLAHLGFDARIIQNAFPQLRHLLAHGDDGLWASVSVWVVWRWP